jgi:hypothetical protein
MIYEGLLSFLNLDYRCNMVGTDGKSYPSLLHALAGIEQDTATKTFIFNEVYNTEEVRAIWEKFPHNWTVSFIDQIINLFIQKYSVLTTELLTYAPDEILYTREEDPLQIFNIITQMIKQGKNASDIMDFLNITD